MNIPARRRAGGDVPGQIEINGWLSKVDEIP
jgi:hypothetical protein